jgi:predicted MFS family arabinose efflux permease
VLVLLGVSTGISGTATALWGFAFGALPVGAQTWITRAAPDHAESAGGLLLTAFQVAIASGAVFGGLLVEGFGARGPIAYCAVAAALACLGALAQARRPVFA